jgi:hypothetical protein
MQLCRGPGIDPEIPGQFDCGTMYANPEEFCGEVDDITGFPAGEAIVPLIQLQTGVVVIMERTQGHSMLVYRKSKAFGSLSGGDRRLDSFVQIHFLISLTYLFRKRIVPTIEEVFPSYYIYVEIREKRSNRLTARNQKT